MINKNLKIIAGPCSINRENIKEIFKIAEIRVNNKPAVWGTRIVGLKSRTNYQTKPSEIGIDNFFFQRILKCFVKNKKLLNKNITIPSIKLAKEIIKKTHLLVATEIMEPALQLPFYEEKIFKGRLFVWNPAVNQLGWPIMVMSSFAKKNNWWIGIKNPKWLGTSLKEAKTKSLNYSTSSEKTWEGIVGYTQNYKKVVLINRGVDIAEKGDYRNYPIHELALRVKKRTGCLLFFDPSHSCGPKLCHRIVDETIWAMKMMISKNEFLYDGILIEVGTSTTDQGQHITLEELKKLINELSKFRHLESNLKNLP